MRARPGDGVHLRGRPQDVIGIFDASADVPRSVTVSCPGLVGPGRSPDLRARVRRELDGSLSTLRLKLPPTTPPGRYECTLCVGDEERAVVIEVEPYPRTRLLSYDGHVSGPPGSEHALTTTVMNLGNVTLDVTPTAQVRLTDGDLIDVVLSAVSARSDSDERLRAFADGLASGDGGTVELRVAKGSGELEPGTTRELSVSVRMPGGLTPGRTYAGDWAIGETRYTLRLHPEAEQPAPKDASETPTQRKRAAPKRAAAAPKSPKRQSR